MNKQPTCSYCNAATKMTLRDGTRVCWSHGKLIDPQRYREWKKQEKEQ